MDSGFVWQVPFDHQLQPADLQLVCVVKLEQVVTGGALLEAAEQLRGAMPGQSSKFRELVMPLSR